MPLPTPKGRQSDVLYFPHAGHIVVLGTAGSGKTTLAILRAHYLSSIAPNQGRTLLATYNRALTTYLAYLAPDELQNVDVRTYHQFARGYLNARGKMGQGQIIRPSDRDSAIAQAVSELRQLEPTPRILQRDPAILAEEFAWIASMGIRTAAKYHDTVRVERAGVRITRLERPHVWAAYQKYLEIRQQRGYLYDWDDLAVATLEELGEDDTDRYYQHVVIDEGQDFSPSMLRSLVAAVPANGTVTFFGDTAQQIYGGRVSWRDAGLEVGQGHVRVIHFEENYRNTQQIAEFALSLANGPYFVGTPDMVVPNAPQAAGALPAIIECATPDVEFNLIVEMAARLGRTRSVAILLRDRRTHEDDYITALTAAGAQVERLDRKMNVWDPRPHVWVGTYYSAKGIEFDTVLLPHVDDNTIPDGARIALLGDATDVCRDDVKLLYVASTRARSELVLTYSGNISRLLSAVDARLYRQVKR